MTRLTETYFCFYGTIKNAGLDADAAAELAIASIAAQPGLTEVEAIAFLDSRHGRHFADEVVCNATAQELAAAISAATATFMGWKISQRTAQDEGIPAGLPYLTGFACHALIQQEAA